MILIYLNHYPIIDYTVHSHTDIHKKQAHRTRTITHIYRVKQTQKHRHNIYMYNCVVIKAHKVNCCGRRHHYHVYKSFFPRWFYCESMVYVLFVRPFGPHIICLFMRPEDAQYHLEAILGQDLSSNKGCSSYNNDSQYTHLLLPIDPGFAPCQGIV